MVFGDHLGLRGYLASKNKSFKYMYKEILEGKKKKSLLVLRPHLCLGRMCLRVTKQEETHPIHHLNLYTAHWRSLVILFLYFFFSSGSHSWVPFTGFRREDRKSP